MDLISDSPPSITSPIASDPDPSDAVTTLDPATVSKRDAIPFEAGQLYAAAYLGYQTTDGLDYYVDRYLDSDKLPIHYISDGDYYLVIPRYNGMIFSLYVNDIETSLGTLRFLDPDCGPFVIQCNASDIFSDVTMCLEYNGETAEFSPYISLKDGATMLGQCCRNRPVCGRISGRRFDRTGPYHQFRRGRPICGSDIHLQADPPH